MTRGKALLWESKLLRSDGVRTLLVVALALTLIGCSRQPSPLASETSCDAANGPGCVERTAAGAPVQLASFRSHSATMHANTMHANTMRTKTVRTKTVHKKAEHKRSWRMAKHADPSRDHARASIYLAAKR